MEYKIGDISFSKNSQYDRVLYWDLFRIYYSLEHQTKELDYASCVTGEYGVLLYKGSIDGKTTDNLYKKLLLETKLWGIEVNNIKQAMDIEVNDILKRYYDRIIKSIPRSILEKIQNIELFKLGYIEKNIYDELMTFKNELKKWLENPKGTSIHYDIDGEKPILASNFHDQIFTIKKEDNKLELIGDEYIVCENCKTIIINHEGNKIINDYKNKENYEFNNIEGYTYFGICLKDSKKKEFLLETNSNEVSKVILETDNIKCIDLMRDLENVLMKKGWTHKNGNMSIGDNITYEYFSDEINSCGWNYLFDWWDFLESDNHIILNKEYIKSNKLKKEFNPKKCIPLIKDKRDNSYYLLDKTSQKVLYTKTNEYVAESMLDLILKIVNDKIEL